LQGKTENLCTFSDLALFREICLVHPSVSAQRKYFLAFLTVITKVIAMKPALCASSDSTPQRRLQFRQDLP
jgi:hypothetical protein